MEEVKEDEEATFKESEACMRINIYFPERMAFRKQTKDDYVKGITAPLDRWKHVITQHLCDDINSRRQPKNPKATVQRADVIASFLVSLTLAKKACRVR